ncbi:MAG: alcohol dehydrogenase catalytic domain-containing protein [Euryarchaeota archaeon]|nr:alcohol dehydrogenase catalytic domain-containing protein [Euryarchaeota archaeon]MDE2044203.1 alcohol dehydrogenase catalytic domain-containing protein [Thermoplasmata archaeon]
MRAAVLWKPGKPDAIRIGTVADPRPGPGEALVRVRATSVNRLDLWIRQGTYRVALPHILGADVVGELEQDSPSGRWRAGARVVVYPGIFCGRCPACRMGHESLCPTLGILGRERHGGYAEMVAVPETNIFPLPGSLPWAEGAAFPLTFLTAEHALNRAALRAGETVLIFGASGGVGCAAISRASRRGARVIAVTGSPQHVPTLRVLGAEEVLMRGSSDLPDRVHALTRGHGADVVVDPVGKAVWSSGVKALARGGRYALVGVTSGAEVEAELRPVYTRQLSLLGGFLGDLGEFEGLVEELARGRIAPTVAETRPLTEAMEAHGQLDRPHFGKIVLTP